MTPQPRPVPTRSRNGSIPTRSPFPTPKGWGNGSGEWVAIRASGRPVPRERVGSVQRRPGSGPALVTRAAALVELRRLAPGLDTTDAGVARLRERIATHAEPEALKDLLAELGAAALLLREAE